MIKRVAVDPLLPSTAERMILLSRDLRVCRGRFLEELAHEWRAVVASHGRLISDARDRIRFEEGLKRVLLASRADRRSFSESGKRWESMVIEREQELDAVATDRALGFRNAVAYGEIELDAPGWHVDVSIEVPRRVDAYVHALAPLTAVSSSAWVVDPYLLGNATSMQRFLIALARQFNGRRPLRLLSLCTVDRGGTSHRDSSVERTLEALNAHGPVLARLARRIEIATWGSGDDGARMHDRYFLTDVGGVQLGNWLSAGAQGVAAFQIVDEEAWASIRPRFDRDHPDHVNRARFDFNSVAGVDLE